jgi:hypothetical protein
MTTHLPRLRVVVGCVLILVLGLLAGCAGGSKKKLSLSGKVTYKGEPVTGGTLTLTPTDGETQPLKSPILANGTYLLTPPGLGEMKVSIETESIRRQTGVRYPGMKEDNNANTSKIAKYKPIPRKYAKPQMSNLSVTIQDGKNIKDFDLTD